MIVKLSNLLRTTLQHGSVDLVPLQEEIEFIQAYLDIEKLRLGKRLAVRLSVDPAIRQMLIPQLILQPLVENAIVHGISCSREGGWIEVVTRAGADAFEIGIRNSIGGESRKGGGLGLQNTRSRLKYLYNGAASISFTIEKDKIAIATLSLPTLLSLGKVQEDPPCLEPANRESGAYASTDR